METTPHPNPLPSKGRGEERRTWMVKGCLGMANGPSGQAKDGAARRPYQMRTLWPSARACHGMGFAGIVTERFLAMDTLTTTDATRNGGANGEAAPEASVDFSKP